MSRIRIVGKGKKAALIPYADRGGHRFLRHRGLMAIRDFTDSTGVRWRVWAVVPMNPASVNDDLRDGWLSFDSANERRRVGPIPRDWEKMTTERLELLCRVATPGRRSDPFGRPKVSGDESTH